MTVAFVCPSCQISLKAKDKNAGRKTSCPNCHCPVTVPADISNLGTIDDDLSKKPPEWWEGEPGFPRSRPYITPPESEKPKEDPQIEIPAAWKAKPPPIVSVRTSPPVPSASPFADLDNDNSPAISIPGRVRNDGAEHVTPAIQPDLYTEVVITFVLYWLCWIPGLFANLIYLDKAKYIERETGRRPPGSRELRVLFMIFGILPPVVIFILVVCSVIFSSARRY